MQGPLYSALMAPLCMQVWVGLAGCALIQAASATPARAGQARRASARRRTGEDAAPPLASLILARPNMQAVE